MRFSSRSSAALSLLAALSGGAFVTLVTASSGFAQSESDVKADGKPADATSAQAPAPTAKSTSPAASAAAASGKGTPLSPDAVQQVDDTTIPGVYKDMVVVQRKAKVKANKFLFAPSGTIDFSDGPITNYAFNTNIGYAISDSWEIYANIVPAFVVVERPIVSKVRALTLANNQQATITYAKPTFQYGGELLWLPAYGKESWSAHSIVRSDTFFKAELDNTMFQSGDSGLRFAALVGKTYFIKSQLNIRVSAGISYAQTVVDSAKTGTWAPVLEAGLVFYFF